MFPRLLCSVLSVNNMHLKDLLQRRGRCCSLVTFVPFKVNYVAREGPPEEPLGMSHSSPSALGQVVSMRLAAHDVDAENYSSVTQPSDASFTFLMYLYRVPRVAL